MNASASLYEEYHRVDRFERFGEETFQGDKAMAAYPAARRVLDFGCGNGLAVRRMRAAGYEWEGVEVSAAAHQRHLQAPYFHLGDTTQFASRRFDMVYSTEVFEHIPEDQVDAVADDLCRIADKYLFMTISLRPSSDNNRYHCTLKSRAWWESKFVRNGFLVDRPVIDCFQRRTLKSTRQIFSKWTHLGPAAAAMASQPPYQLFGESQFWFFIFRREGIPPAPLPQPTQPWPRRKLTPLVRRWLQLDAWERVRAA